MKEIRPATWIAFIVMGLMIFVPAFFIDMGGFINKPDEFDQKHSVPPRPNTTGPQVPAGNEPPANSPPGEDVPQD